MTGNWMARAVGPLALVAAGLMTAACEQKKPAAVAPPPPKVTAARPVVRDVTQWDEYTGSLEAVESVDVRAQVSGYIDTVNFTEGALVHKGDLLATIDSRIFQATVDSAKAQLLQARAKLEQAQANLALAQSDLHRTEAASRNGAVSIEEVETKRSNVLVNQAGVGEANAGVAVADAELKTAEQNLSYCRITAPIDGRISSRYVTPGNMITGGPGQATTLTRIKSINPIYCYVNADESSVLRYQKLAREKKRESAENTVLKCYIGLQDEVGFPHTGVIDFLDVDINRTTGTRRVRGVFDNADGALLPGLFARFRVAGQTFPQALLVIDDAVGTDQDRKFVYLLHPDNTIERRTVTVGPLIDELRVIVKGLNSDDQVIVNGLSSLAMVRPGGTVSPETTPMPEHRLREVAAASTQRSATASAPASAPATQSSSSNREGAR